MTSNDWLAALILAAAVALMAAAWIIGRTSDKGGGT